MVSKLKAKFLPKDYHLNLFKQMQNLKQKGMSVKEYTEEFYRLNIRTGHVEDDLEEVARYINGLRGKNPAKEGKILESKVQHSQNEAGSASNRAPQRGDFGRGRFVPRGRGRGRYVRCFACGKWEHVQWDCPHQRSANQRNVNVAEAKEEIPQPEAKEEPPEDGESLLLKRVLLEGAKEAKEPVQRKTLFRTICKSKGKCCKLIIDSGSTDNLVSTEMVDKLKLERTVHPTPYKVSWLQKGHQIFVTEQCQVEFQIGTDKDVILCDVMPIDVCHILLGRPWQFDRNAIHDGRRNTYTLEKDGNKHTLLPLKAEDNKEALGNSITLMNEKTLLQEDEKGKEMHLASVGKPKVILTSTNLEDLPEEIQNFLNDYADIVVDESLPIRSISNHNDLILGVSFPNKVAYRVMQENVEAGTQVKESMDKWLIIESLNPCVVPIALSPKKEVEWCMTPNSRALYKITIRVKNEDLK
eukprot:PITA_09769